MIRRTSFLPEVVGCLCPEEDHHRKLLRSLVRLRMPFPRPTPSLELAVRQTSRDRLHSSSTLSYRRLAATAYEGGHGRTLDALIGTGSLCCTARHLSGIRGLISTLPIPPSACSVSHGGRAHVCSSGKHSQQLCIRYASWLTTVRTYRSRDIAVSSTSAQHSPVPPPLSPRPRHRAPELSANGCE